MNKLIDALSLVIGVIATGIAVWQFFAFITYKYARGLRDMMAGINHLWLAVGAAVVACACAVTYYIRHAKPAEEIHITE